MNVISYPRTIFIVGGDTALSHSTQFLLETRNYKVNLVEAAEGFPFHTLCREHDIVLLDLNDCDPAAYKLLNRLMFSPKRPSIVVLTGSDKILRPDDCFPGERIRVLVQPVAPDALLRAVEMSG